jgi:hypothetical protein
MKKLLIVIYTWCLLLLLGCGVLLLVAAPKEATVSETENRMLEAFPSADAQSLFSGAFSTGFEQYLSDHFFLRDGCIRLTNAIKDRLSLLSDADELKLAALDERVDAPAQNEPEPTDAPHVSEEPSEDPILAETPAPTAAATTAPTAAAKPVPTQEAAVPSEPSSGLIRIPMSLPSPMPRTPLYEHSAATDKNLDERAYINLIDENGSRTQIARYYKCFIRDGAHILNRLAALLPEDGHMYVVQAQRGEHVLQYTIALDRYTAYESEVEDYLEPLLDERISLFRCVDILEPHIRAGEYIYYYTDHHWTPLGAYYIHKAMIEAQGKKAVPYTENRLKPQSGNFIGTNIEAAERVLPKGTKDHVEEIEPSLAYDFYRVQNIHELTPMPLNNPDAKGYQAILWLNLRPWKMIRSYENNGRKMLLICDSMGMAFAPFMAYYYDEVHVVRPHSTYFSVKEAGGTIKQYIDYWGIDDIYVVQANFFTGDLYRVELARSIGDEP